MSWFGKGKRRRSLEPAFTERKSEAKATSVNQKTTADDIAQLSMRGDAEVVERFRQLCRTDRRTYLEMLSILMDHYDGPGPH